MTTRKGFAVFTDKLQPATYPNQICITYDGLIFFFHQHGVKNIISINKKHISGCRMSLRIIASMAYPLILRQAHQFILPRVLREKGIYLLNSIISTAIIYYQ